MSAFDFLLHFSDQKHLFKVKNIYSLLTTGVMHIKMESSGLNVNLYLFPISQSQVLNFPNSLFFLIY